MVKQKKKKVNFFRPTTLVFIILLLIAILAALLIPYLRLNISSNLLSDTPDPLVIKDEILSIDFFYNQGADSLFLEKNKDGSWFFRDKPKIIISSDVIQFLCDQINDLDVIRTLDSTETDDAYGLLIPVAQIKLIFSDGTSYFLDIGNPTPIESGYYSKVNSSEVKIISYDQTLGILNLFFFGILPGYLSNSQDIRLTPQGP
jgi:hypothetical protein